MCEVTGGSPEHVSGSRRAPERVSGNRRITVNISQRTRITRIARNTTLHEAQEWNDRGIIPGDTRPRLGTVNWVHTDSLTLRCSSCCDMTVKTSS